MLRFKNGLKVYYEKIYRNSPEAQTEEHRLWVEQLIRDVDVSGSDAAKRFRVEREIYLDF